MRNCLLVVLIALSSILWGCASSTTPPVGLTVTARLGVYQAGSSRSLALLVILRDEAGRGPDAPVSLSLRAPNGVNVKSFVYDDATEGSFAAFWWPEVPVEAGEYRLEGDPERVGSHALVLAPVDLVGLAPPTAVLSTDGSLLAWEPSDAGSFRCEFYSTDALVGSTGISTEPGCELTALPAGAFRVNVQSFSVDLAALHEDHTAAPSMPEAFHVSQSTLGIFRPSDATAGLQLRASGGSFHYGPLSGGLSVWISIAEASGAAPSLPFSLSILGPRGTISATYPAGVRHVLLTSYSLGPDEGSYSVIAKQGNVSVVGGFTLRGIGTLTIPQGVVATPQGTGGASISWEAVAGARSYRVTLWEPGGGGPVTTVWSDQSPARFPPGTLVGGRRYEAYVAAATVAMAETSLLETPPAVLVSENIYSPAALIAQ